ncbi:MAG: UDP-2,3-diacylglucosamine diphosphatase [Proteobacteria bacterium]|nr:UDP-2,3-diacylglucosamine diphosphatase [Burkholderiales bacterium]
MPHTLFISDLHLSATRPHTTQAFADFLRRRATGADALYILGDLFDFWIGDDDLEDPLNARVVDALAALTAAGVPVWFMHGNRDFLVGARFADATGVRILDDPTVIDVYGTRTLLMHGDTLCIEDTRYNALRATVRDPGVQQAFLARTLDARRAEVQRMRAISEQEKQTKSNEIMDVTPSEVLRTLRRHGYPRLIHGHTHRPMRHAHPVDGRVCERWVLADWADAPVGGVATHRGFAAMGAAG